MSSSSRLGTRQRDVAGVTIIELAVVLLLIGLLVAIARPLYRGYHERALIAGAVNGIEEIALAAKAFENEYNNPPLRLEQLGKQFERDPWGQAYQYLNVNDPTPGTQGQRRKDHNLVPINSDFDLYSVGPDGQSQPPLTAPTSRDDVIRARNGGYLGVAERF